MGNKGLYETIRNESPAPFNIGREWIDRAFKTYNTGTTVDTALDKASFEAGIKAVLELAHEEARHLNAQAASAHNPNWLIARAKGLERLSEMVYGEG